MKDRQHSISNIRLDGLQSGDEVSQKTCRVVIPFVQRQPGDRSPATGYPFADKCGFTKSGRGRDKGHAWRMVQAPVQPLEQARAENNIRARRGDIEFGG